MFLNTECDGQMLLSALVMKTMIIADIQLVRCSTFLQNIRGRWVNFHIIDTSGRCLNGCMILTSNSTEEVENENVTIVFSTISMPSVVNLERSEEERNRILIIAGALGIAFFTVFLLFCFMAAQLTKRRNREEEQERRARRLRVLKKVKLRLRSIEKARKAKRKKALDDDRDLRSPRSDPREVKAKARIVKKKRSHSDSLGPEEADNKVDQEIMKRRRQAYDNMDLMDRDWDSERGSKDELKHFDAKVPMEIGKEQQRGSKEAVKSNEEKPGGPKGSKESAKSGGDKPKGSKESAKSGEDKPKGSKESAKSGEEKPKGSKESAKSGEEKPTGSKESAKSGEEKPKGLKESAKLGEEEARGPKEAVESPENILKHPIDEGAKKIPAKDKPSEYIGIGGRVGGTIWKV